MIRRLVGLPDPGLGSPLPTEHVSQYAQVYAQREGQERTIDPEVPLETVVEHFEAEYFGTAPDLSQVVSVQIDDDDTVTTTVSRRHAPPWAHVSTITRSGAEPSQSKLLVVVGGADCAKCRQQFSALGYDCLQLGALGAPAADSLADRTFRPAEHIDVGAHTCGAIALNVAVMRLVLARVCARRRYASVVAYGCSRYGKTAVWLAAKAKEVTGLFLQSAGPGGAAVSSLTGAGGETLHALAHPQNWAAWYRLGLAARVDGLLRSERFVDFDALHVALAVHRGVTIYLVSYWTDVWNSPLGARALYESARRYTSNIGLEQRHARTLVSRLVTLPLLGVGPHCRTFPGLATSLEHYAAFLRDKEGCADPYAAEYRPEYRRQVEDWLRGTAKCFVNGLVVCEQTEPGQLAVPLSTTGI